MPIQTDFIQKPRIDSDPFESIEKSAGLYQVFSRDQMSRKAEIGFQPTKEIEFSLWKKIKSWFTSPTDSSEMAKPPLSVSEQHEPIHLIPELDAPPHYPKDLQEASLPPIKNRASPFKPREVMEILNSLEDKTVAEIMMIIAHMQLDLEKENALVAENCFTQIQNMKKIKENALLEIKAALLKDEKVLAKCNRAQYVAFIAAGISGILATAATFGVLAPVGILASIATLAPVAAGAMTGITTAAKAYSEIRKDEDQAIYLQFHHEEKSIGTWLNEAIHRLQNIAEVDQAFKERILKVIHDVSRMNRMMLQK